MVWMQRKMSEEINQREMNNQIKCDFKLPQKETVPTNWEKLFGRKPFLLIRRYKELDELTSTAVL